MNCLYQTTAGENHNLSCLNVKTDSGLFSFCNYNQNNTDQSTTTGLHNITTQQIINHFLSLQLEASQTTLVKNLVCLSVLCSPADWCHWSVTIKREY